ncbi:MAG: DUF6174 domain-containing protein [Solirubrobacteraceae bacterium]
MAAAAALLVGAAASSAVAQAPASVDPGIADGTAQRELDAAKQRWQAAGIGDYHFTVERQCFCAPSFRGPVTIVVRGGAPDATTPAAFQDIATVPRLHAIVQQAIDDRVERLDVTYDARGVPLAISIDRSSMVADDEIAYLVSGFTVDSRSRPLVDYRRSGGFIGVDDRLSVAHNGLATRTERGGAPEEFQLSPADLGALKDVLEAADFPSLKPVYKPPFPLSDGFVYTVTYRAKTVVVFEGAAIPAPLDAAIAALGQLFAAPPA